MNGKSISRHGFLQKAALGCGSLALRPFRQLFPLTVFPEADRLGRVNASKIVKIFIKSLNRLHTFFKRVGYPVTNEC